MYMKIPLKFIVPIHFKLILLYYLHNKKFLKNLQFCPDCSDCRDKMDICKNTNAIDKLVWRYHK